MDITTLKTLIQIPSMSGSEAEIQKFIFTYGKEHRIEAFFQEKNVIFHIKGTNRKKALIFNGHVDTVSPGNLTDWAHQPFGETSGVIEDDKLFGLGSSDMKSGVFAIMEVAKHFQQNTPSIDLWFSFVVNEEVDGAGSKAFVLWFKEHHLSNYEEIAAIIAEPTDMAEIEIGHRGNYFLEIITRGDSGHGAYPENIKTHSVLQMFEIVKKLQELEKQWQQKYSHEYLGKPTIALCTSIEAGSKGSPNKFPDVCSATFDVRTTPELHPMVMKEVQEVLKHFSCEVNNLYDPSPFSYTSPDQSIVKLLQNINQNLSLTVAKGSSDQCFFSEVGIPTVVIGPGIKKVIHKANEYCELSKVEQSIELYKSVVHAML